MKKARSGSGSGGAPMPKSLRVEPRLFRELDSLHFAEFVRNFKSDADLAACTSVREVLIYLKGRLEGMKDLDLAKDFKIKIHSACGAPLDFSMGEKRYIIHCNLIADRAAVQGALRACYQVSKSMGAASDYLMGIILCPDEVFIRHNFEASVPGNIYEIQGDKIWDTHVTLDGKVVTAVCASPSLRPFEAGGAGAGEAAVPELA